MDIELTKPQLNDLKKAIATHKLTVGSFNWPDGMSVRLRTGKALEKLGLVKNQRSRWNKNNHWIPTKKGIDFLDKAISDD